MTQAVVSAVEEVGQARGEPPEIEDQTVEHLLTFQEYLEYEGEPDVLYELFRGQLIPMSAAMHLHTNICKFLIYKLQRYFADQNLDLVANSLATGVRTEENSSRIPDVVVCSQAVWAQVLHRDGAGVLDFAEKPILVVEVTSSNARDDYVIKRSEYEIAEIPEYWIVDPKNKRVRVFANPSRVEGYSFVDFTAKQSIISGQFEQLVLSVKELLAPLAEEQLIKAEQDQIKTLRQRAEKLAQRLLEMGVNPEEID